MELSAGQSCQSVWRGKGEKKGNSRKNKEINDKKENLFKLNPERMGSRQPFNEESSQSLGKVGKSKDIKDN